MRPDIRPPMLPWVMAAVLVSILGAVLVHGMEAWSAVNWMNIYRVEDFSDLESVLSFFADLRIAIPPWIAAIEFANHLTVGGTGWTTIYLYRASIVGAYVLALFATYPSHERLALATGLSVLFIAATAHIHPAGPNVYDPVYPALVLAFIVLLARAHRSAGMAFLAGLVLSLVELTRPFATVLLPVFLMGGLLQLRSASDGRFRSKSLLFLLPIMLLSGGWHLHLWLNHGQVAWSNHAGFNLQRAWNTVAIPPLVPESTPAKLAPDRMENFNTPEHIENSRRVQRAVLDHILANPARSALHVGERLATLLNGDVRLHGNVPQGPVIEIYGALLKFPALWILGATVALGLAVLRWPWRIADIIGDPGNLLIVTTAATLIVTAVTEAGEEARFMIALLPMLAAVPMPKWRFDHRPMARSRSRLALVLAILAMLAIEAFVQASTRRPAGEALGTGPQMPPTESASSLRLGSLHVRGGRWKDREQAAAAIAACLRGLDLVGLNGVSGARLLSRQPDQAETLARLTGTASIFAPTERRWGGDSYGNALLTTRSIAQWRRETLASPRTQPKRNSLRAETAFAGTTLSLVVTQIDAGYDRDEQLAEVIQRFRALPEPAILMGELNATADLPVMRDLLADSRVRYAIGEIPTATGPRPVDWIIGRGLYISPASYCDTGVSDHPAIVVEIKPLS